MKGKFSISNSELIKLPFDPRKKFKPLFFVTAKNFVFSIFTIKSEGYLLNTKKLSTNLLSLIADKTFSFFKKKGFDF